MLNDKKDCFAFREFLKLKEGNIKFPPSGARCTCKRLGAPESLVLHK